MGALRAIFSPESIAVVGASRNTAKLGFTILHNLLQEQYQGTIYPVNPKAKSIHGVRAYPSLSAIPDPVDLAIIVVPAEYVKGVFEECVQKGVKGAVVITAGFSEIGGEGLIREAELVELAAKGGMRFVGPNCMGVINSDPAIRMNGTFAPVAPQEGSIAFMTQSGALGVAILQHARAERVGLSKFVSMGNKASISSNDLLLDFGQDDRTDVVLMYLENFGNPRNFIRIAREVTATKPVIAVKSGRTMAGARAASSHTGSLAGSDIAAEALLKQCGVLRATSIEELFDLAVAFSSQPLPTGTRVGILTNAGGPAIMTADAAEAAELTVPTLSPEVQERIRSYVPEEAAVSNPVDLIASATPEQYEKVLQEMLANDSIDMAIVLSVPLGIDTGLEVAEAIVRGVDAAGRTKPVLACVMGQKSSSPGVEHLVANGIPCYRYPESAVRAADALFEYQQWRARDKGTIPTLDYDKEAVAALVAKGSSRENGRLTDGEARELFQLLGVTYATSHLTNTVEEALDAAADVGFPLVLKIDSAELVHKSDVGGVRLGVRDESDLLRQWRELKKTAEEHNLPLNGIRVEQQVRGGKEVIVGMSSDLRYGPMVMVGMGGVYVEVLKDVAFRLAPLTTADANEQVKELRGYPILTGVRGEAPSDVAALERLLLAISTLADDHPEVAELDLNPVMVLPDGQGIIAVDGRLRARTQQERDAEDALRHGKVRGH